MKFVHIADMHFDAPFSSLNDENSLGSVRRLEQRKVFKKIIEYIKENKVDYFFIVGDLYEHQYVKKSTIDYINQLFKEIENTKVLITPGNHDPYLKDSYYEQYDWNNNVYICKNNFDIVQDENIDFYMTGFTNYYMNESPLKDIKIVNWNKINILLTHCDLNGSIDKNGMSYNPISEAQMRELKFDYVAMGHIHKSNFIMNKRIVYPGSTISFGFDELGEHGMVVGEISEDKFYTKFIRLDDRMFKILDFDVKNIYSQEELVEAILKVELDKNCMYEIQLVGEREFSINTKEIFKLLNIENILKLKDLTHTSYNIEEIAKERNIRGMFVKEVIKKYELGIYTEEQITKAIEIGLESLK